MKLRAVKLAIAVSVLAAVTASADNTLRRHLKPINEPKPSVTVVSVADTVAATGGELTFAGYDKPLLSRKETFLVTNHYTDTVRSVTVRINYLDLSGRQLHSDCTTLECDIPPGQTRSVAKKSWDLQQTYYYHLGKKPRTAGVTPFTVTITPINFTVPKR